MTSSKEYVCECHRRLGNDFWFLPRNSCLYTDGCAKPGEDPCADRRAFLNHEHASWGGVIAGVVAFIGMAYLFMDIAYKHQWFYGLGYN